MLVLALTGSIGMGKSTTAAMFRDCGVPVHDADATVHELYGGATAREIEALFPGTLKDGAIDRAKLGAIVLSDSEAMKKLEALVHPKVWAAEQDFLAKARAAGEPLVILDIPLLFETGGENRVDGVIVVTCSAEEQRRRVLSRPGMTPAKLEAILARQVPDNVKRQKADFLVDTGRGMAAARRQVEHIVADIRAGKWSPKQRPRA
jgi:dephospho-CoA kinase